MIIYYHDPLLEGLLYGLSLGIKKLYYDFCIYMS